MRITSRLLAVVALTCLVATGAVAQDYMGPTLEGTVTLRSGQQISGIILTAQLGIVDGAEIGSRLRDGGYIAVNVDGDERRVDATDIAAIDVEWSQTGAEDDPKWKITSLSVTTDSGEVISGQPAWLVHATSLIVETEDGTQKKIYAFPMAGSNFSPENLMSAISLTSSPAAEAVDTGDQPAVDEEPVTDEQAAVDEPVTDEERATDEEPATDEEAPAQPATGTPGTVATPVEGPAAETAEEPVADADEEPGAGEEADGETPAVEPGVGVGMDISSQPSVEAVPEGSVFATGQPAVITFEVTNPETGNPMQVRFLIVPLPVE